LLPGAARGTRLPAAGFWLCNISPALQMLNNWRLDYKESICMGIYLMANTFSLADLYVLHISQAKDDVALTPRKGFPQQNYKARL
jgi:hypothetical protein